MEKLLMDELKKCSEILELYYKDMVDIDFVVENKKLYILSVRQGKRTPMVNLKIVMSMFCEGKLDAEDVINRLPYQQLETILNSKAIVNAGELCMLIQGVSASNGACAAIGCFTHQEAETFIDNRKSFIYCCLELSPEDISIITSPFCKGVVSARGGITSHAAVACRGLQLPCVAGITDFDGLEKAIKYCNNELTIDGSDGKVYAGLAAIENKNVNLLEIIMLRKLLQTITKYNVITSKKSFLVWRLWNVLILNRRYARRDNQKQIVYKDTYISFKQPTKHEQECIKFQLKCIENGEILIEDLIDFLQSELSTSVSLGCHYKYMRPLIDPLKSMVFKEHHKIAFQGVPCGSQLTGIEFFNINKFVDYLIDIYSIKIYFTTPFFQDEFNDKNTIKHFPLNYLDYTNPKGESLIINTYDVDQLAIFINDVLISAEKLPLVYHLIRKRKYFWNWYEENNVSKIEITNYLKSNVFKDEIQHSKKYYLCEELNLIKNNELTLAGKSLIWEGKEEMKNNTNIDYILDEVVSRGYNEITNECNDFLELLKRKDFKELIALELYELYFWNERHEFDLELLREIINSVADYFTDPETIKQIESGILQNLPTTIIASLVGTIVLKLKGHFEKKSGPKKKTSWECIEENIKKIDVEFSNHDYVLSNEIEKIFKTSREEIQPLLKLCGCKCYIDKNRSIWIKAGIKEERIKEILKEHNFKYKKNNS